MSSGMSIVDSSVAVKWFKAADEAHVDEALGLLALHEAGESELAAPTHLRLEVLNALWSAGTSLDDLRIAATVLAASRLQWHEPDDDLMQAAAELAVRHALTIYDAVYAALANRLDSVLVTADRKLADSGACRTRLL
jgi:predicted nucleic acid-binding protein